MHRQTGILEVISLWLQEGIKPTTMLQKGLRQAITDFASWQQATRVTLGRCPQGLFTDCRTGWEPRRINDYDKIYAFITRSIWRNYGSSFA